MISFKYIVNAIFTVLCCFGIMLTVYYNTEWETSMNVCIFLVVLLFGIVYGLNNTIYKDD
jgi:hypothetical protein